ncbi:Crp/Fnr family transcriptional regulator [Cupriavidus sp. 30B13]|uniref:Crp/Fnr family transcriptional regulator n=1 Tax=Cupriavidus sp. 30B13 TaxID=3384241 RepID=UPI003B8F482A
MKAGHVSGASCSPKKSPAAFAVNRAAVNCGQLRSTAVGAALRLYVAHPQDCPRWYSPFGIYSACVRKVPALPCGIGEGVMAKVDRAQAERVLARVGWLSQQPKAFQAQVLQRSVLMRFGPRETIYRCGDPLGGVYGIVQGAVTVTTAPPAATPRLLHLGMPGSWIGEGCFLVREPRRVGMQAAMESWVMHLPLDAMDQIASQDALAVRHFTRILMQNLDILVRAFYDLQNPDEHRRVALALLRISPAAGNAIPLSQADLGVMSNTQRKGVNAALQRFAAAGWVSKRYRSVTLTDIGALRRFASAEQ